MMRDVHESYAFKIQCCTEQRAANVVSHDLWFFDEPYGQLRTAFWWPTIPHVIFSSADL